MTAHPATACAGALTMPGYAGNVNSGPGTARTNPYPVKKRRLRSSRLVRVHPGVRAARRNRRQKRVLTHGEVYGIRCLCFAPQSYFPLRPTARLAMEATQIGTLMRCW
jgi:hypothetical protein